MHWLQKRLLELKGAPHNKSGAGLAKAMGLKNKQRVYAIWTPDANGKTRKIQPTEYGPIARYVEMTEAEVYERETGSKMVPVHTTEIRVNAPYVSKDTDLSQRLQFRSARSRKGQLEGFMLYAENGLDERDQEITESLRPFTFKVLDNKNDPVYRVRDTLAVDPTFEIIVGEDCVFSADTWPPAGGFCVIARLLSDNSTTWFCRSLATKEEFQLNRSDFPNAWPIIGRERPR